MLLTFSGTGDEASSIPHLKAAAVAQVELSGADSSVRLTATEAPQLLADGGGAAADVAKPGSAAADALAAMRITGEGAEPH